MYQASAPLVGSKSQLPIWKSNRGVESTLEKAHYSLAYFDNKNMRYKLADALTISGIAQYNLKIQYCPSLQRMTPIERAKIPSVYRSFPYHIDHSCLAYINELTRQA